MAKVRVLIPSAYFKLDNSCEKFLTKKFREINVFDETNYIDEIDFTNFQVGMRAEITEI